MNKLIPSKVFRGKNFIDNILWGFSFSLINLSDPLQHSTLNSLSQSFTKVFRNLDRF